MNPPREKEVVAIDPQAIHNATPIRVEQIASELYESYMTNTPNSPIWEDFSTTADADRFRAQAWMLCSKFWLRFLSDAIEGYGIRGAKSRVSGEIQQIFKKNN